jgi:hypothetical protein
MTRQISRDDFAKLLPGDAEALHMEGVFIFDRSPISLGFGTVEWPDDLPSRLYVVACANRSGEAPSPEAAVWTLSPALEHLGWENDCNTEGYGLPFAIAQAVADAYNNQRRYVPNGISPA